MPRFSPASLKRLESVHPDLQTVFHHVVIDFDCTVLEGVRTAERQHLLYTKGRPDNGPIVTQRDGIIKRSKHQDGLAVDVVPFPIDWDDTDHMRSLGWYVKGIARMLKQYGAIDNDIKWGGDWRFIDLPHFEI